jgi:peroxiredoxin Q/BCP
MTRPSALGIEVPDFTAESTAGPVKLSDHAGRPVVLYFYPKDDTPGCTTESADFAKLHDAFAARGAVVFGVSRDSLKSHQNFRTKLALPFLLISDPGEALCGSFDVIGTKRMYGREVRGVIRSTFVIDAQGRLAHEWRGVKVPGHAAAVLAALDTGH